MDELIGMNVKKADKILSQKGYATVWFKEGDEVDMTDAASGCIFMILIHDAKNKVLEIREWER